MMMRKIVYLVLFVFPRLAAMSSQFDHHVAGVLAAGGVVPYSRSFTRLCDGVLCYRILPQEECVATCPEVVALSETCAAKRESIFLAMMRQGLYKMVPALDNSRQYYQVWHEVCCCFGLPESEADIVEDGCIDDGSCSVGSLARLIDGIVHINPRCRHVSYGMMRFVLFCMGARIKHHDKEVKELLRAQRFSLPAGDCYDAFSERRAHAIALGALDCAWCAKQVCDADVLRICLSEQEIGQLVHHLVVYVERLHEMRPVVVERVLCAWHSRQKLEFISETL